MFEWDERVGFDENATTIGRIRAIKEKEVELDELLFGVTYTVTYGNRLDLLITLVRRRSDVCLGRLV